jgi:hypothetical protein
VRFIESERKFTEEEIAKFAEVQVLDIPDELLSDDELADIAGDTVIDGESDDEDAQTAADSESEQQEV